MNIRILSASIALAFSLSLQAAESDGYLDEAKAFLSDGDVNAAVIQLKNALQEDPVNVEARLMLGKIYLKQGDGASAEKELRRAVRLKAPKVRWQVELGKAYLLQNKFNEVIDEIEPDPTFSGDIQAEVLSLRGLAYLGKRDMEQARTEFGKALASRPDFQDAMLGMARVLLLSGEKEEGLKELNSLLSLYPDSVPALIMRGELFRQDRALDQALADFNRAIELNPKSVKALLGRVAISLQQNNYELASKDLEQLSVYAPGSPIIHYLKGVLAFQQRDFPQAEEQIQLVLQVLPNHPQSQLIYGATLFAKGDLPLADEYLSRALVLLPGHLPTIKLLAAARTKMRQPKRAVEVLEPALAQHPEDAQIMAMLGNAYLQTGRYQEGSDLLSKAVEINPEVAALRTQLAFGLLAQGKTSGAIDELQSAVDMGQDLIQADILLVLSHLRNKEIDTALEASEALEARMPENPVAYNLTGLAYLAAGKEEEAGQKFRQALAIDPKFVTAEINLARIEISHDRLDGAEAHFKAALVQAPNNLNVLIGMAGLAERRGDRAAMYSWLQKAQVRNPKSSKPGVLLITAYLKDGDKLKALRVANETASNFPNQSQVLRALGVAQMTAGEPNSAVRSLQQLVAVQRSPQNLTLLANAQRVTKDAEAARGSLEAALELKPDYLPALIALGTLELAADDLDKARETGRSIQGYYPKRGVGYEFEAVVLLKEKKLDEALKAFQQAYQLSPSAKLAIQMTRLYGAKGEMAQGLAQLEDWLEKSPNDVATRSTYGLLLQDQGHKKEAIVQYEKVLESLPENVLVLNNLAWLYQEEGNNRAIELGEKAYRLSPKRPEIADTYGWILVNSGMSEKGLPILQNALVLAPENPEIAYHVGFALNKMGRRGEAEKVLRRVSKQHPDSPFAKQAQELLSQ